MEKYRLKLKLKDGQSLGYIQMDNGYPYYDYGYAEATLFDSAGVLNLLNKIPFDHYDVFAEVDYTTNKGRKGKTALRNEELKTYMQNELNDKSEQFMENKIMDKKTMYDDLGNARTPEEWAKGISDGTVNEDTKTVKEHLTDRLKELGWENLDKAGVEKEIKKMQGKGWYDKYTLDMTLLQHLKEFGNDLTEMYDELGNHITPEEYAKGVANGTINENNEFYFDDKTERIVTEKPKNSHTVIKTSKSLEQFKDDFEKAREEGNSIIDSISIAESVEDGTINEENTNKEGAYINRADGKYAVHAKKWGGAIKYTSSLDAAYNYLTKKFGIDRKDVEYIKESVEDESDDNMLALEDYLVNSEGEDPSEVEIKAGYTDNSYDTPWGEYYVFGSYEEAEQAAIEYEKETLEEIGIDALNWDYMPYEIGHYVDKDWFQAAMEESNQFLVDDMSNMDKMGYLEDILDESDFREAHRGELEEVVEADSDIDSMDLYDMLDALDMFSEYDEEIVEKLNNQYADPIEWYRDNFGDKDFGQVAIEKNLVDLDAVAEAVVETDGPANALARYDGKEIEWESNGNYYYIYRND